MQLIDDDKKSTSSLSLQFFVRDYTLEVLPPFKSFVILTMFLTTRIHYIFHGVKLRY
jgi:hypothetical protein